MMTKTLPLLACLMVSSAVLAQTQTQTQATECRANDPQRKDRIIGKTADVKGLATVSAGTQVVGVANDAPVVHGTRYVTSSTGFVTLKFDGCEVNLKPNQSLIVDECKICDGMIASIEGVPGAALAGAGAGAAPGVGLIVTGIILLQGSNGPGGGTLPGGGGGTPGGGGGQIPDNPPVSNQ